MTRVVCDVGQPRRMETCGAEEPYEGNLPVRFCGGIGRVIADPTRTGDGCQRPLVPRDGCQPRLTPGVRLLPYTHLTEQIENDLPLYPQTVYNRRMDILYQLQGVEFEWDEEKARSNIANHGVTFEEAAEVFFDPFYQGGDASTEDEAREFIIGYSLAPRLLLVVYGDRGRTDTDDFCASDDAP